MSETSQGTTTTPCAVCGTMRDPTAKCPKCGNTPEILSVQIAQLNKEISELNTEDLRLIGERKRLSSKLQAALYQRDILAYEEGQREKKSASKQSRWRRSHAAPVPPVIPTVPQQPRVNLRPRTTPRPRVAPLDENQPEASARSMQNILLALGSLLIAIAAAVFALLAQSDPQIGALNPLLVLAVATILLLIPPPMLMRKGLSSTAESLATVGLALLPVDGFLLIRLLDAGESKVQYGLVFAATATIAVLYHRATALTSARYALVLAAQPVLLLLTYDLVKDSWTGLAVVLTLTAAQNAVIARGLELYQSPEPSPNGWSSYWLRELTWVLHGIAIGTGGMYAVSALVTANAIDAAARAALAVMFASIVGLGGALMLHKRPLGDLAAGAVTLAIIGSSARVALLAVPDRALLLISIVVVITGIAVRALPETARSGPQLASAVALAATSVFVIGGAVRAAWAPIRTAWPMWEADLHDFVGGVATRADHPGWELMVTVALLTAGAALALPPAYRREAAIVGTVLTALAAPASLGLGWPATMWVLTLAALGILGAAVTMPAVRTLREARAHVAGFVVLSGIVIAISTARSYAVAGVLTAIAISGVLLALYIRELASREITDPSAAILLIGDAAAGAAAFAAPSAVGTGLRILIPDATPAAALAAAFVTSSITLVLVVLRLVAHRRIGAPLAIGTSLGALVVAGASFGLGDTYDAGVGALVLVGAILLMLAPSIDAGRRADRWLDGADVAAAAITTAAIASLVRIVDSVYHPQLLFFSAVTVLVVAIGIRAMPEDWRRGPAVGAGVAGAAIALVAGYWALTGGFESLTLPGELWASTVPPTVAPTKFGWQGPLALLALAGAAAIALPKPRNYDAAAAAVILATVGTPAALGWPWWSPIVLGLAISAAYAIAAVFAPEPRAGYARLAVAVSVAFYALGCALVRPWTTAAALGVVALVSTAVVILSVTLSKDDAFPRGDHLPVLGGSGLVGALTAGPAALAAFAASAKQPYDVVFTVTLAGAAVGLAFLAAAKGPLAAYLRWGTVGVAISSTLVSVLALLADRPAGVYAAAATLLVVLAELIRVGTVDRPEPVVIQRRNKLRGPYLWPTYRGSMAAAAAAVPALIALASLIPAMSEAIIKPHDSLNAVWDGPPAPYVSVVDLTDVFTAVILTLAAAMAAIGFGGGMTRAVSVVVPGAAVTLLIAPLGLHMAWPASVMAALLVFTLCMLSVALTDPPGTDESARGVRFTRGAILFIGLIGGGAGLAGALATAELTIFTFVGAVGVGATAALGGRSEVSRIGGWMFAAISAQFVVLTVSLRLGVKPEWAAFAVLGVGALLIVSAALLPRFNRADAQREASAVEWSGYAAAVIALALASQSLPHIAALLVAWGAVLGMAGGRPGRPGAERRLIFWAAAGSEIVAWWIIMSIVGAKGTVLPEVYTIPFAVLALVVGRIELKRRPSLGSWTTYGPALIAGFGPTLVVALFDTDADPVLVTIRETVLLVAAIVVLVLGSRAQQRAPVVVGSIVTTITAFHALALLSATWLSVLIGGIVLLVLGANSERRRRASERYQMMK